MVIDGDSQRYLYVIKILNKIGKEAESKGTVITYIKSPYFTSLRKTVNKELKKDMSAFFEMKKEDKAKLPQKLKDIIEPEIKMTTKECREEEDLKPRGQIKEKTEGIIKFIESKLKDKDITKEKKESLEIQLKYYKDVLKGKKPEVPKSMR